MRRRDLMSAPGASGIIDYAYIQIYNKYLSYSDDTAVINKVSASFTGANQVLDPITGRHENVALQRLRDSSHLYMGKYSNGKMLLKQLKDDDGTKYLDGTTAIMTGADGEHWLRINEPFYIKRYSGYDSGTRITYAIAVGGQPNSSWKQIIGTDDLLAVHEAVAANTNDNTIGVLHSRSGSQSTANITRNNFKAKARNKSTGHTLVTWEWHCVMQLLFYAWYGRTNAQAQCGAGSQSSTRILGTKDSLGMTDTTSDNGNDDNTKFWGIENWWGDKYEFVDNVDIEDRVWTVTDVKTGSTRTAGTGASSSNWISKMLLSANLDFIPVDVVSSSYKTNYYTDYYNQDTGSRILLRSYYSNEDNGGVSCIITRLDSSYKGIACGTRLAYHGDIEIIS